MAIQLEDHLPVVRYNGLNTEKAVTLAGTNTLSGATTLSGTTTISGNTTFSGTTVGVRNDFEIVASGNKTVTAAMSGRIFMATAASGTQTFTLPDAGTTAGLRYQFICGNAGGEILVTPASGDLVRIKATEDAGASVAPAAGTGVKNTAATNVLGDHLDIVFDGTDTWHMVGQSGIWASQ